MKAYVIKNKKGKYLGVCSSDYSHYWTSIDFAHYFRYLPNHDPKQDAEDFKNGKYPDCKVVEITITEDDLEQQLAIVEKALELACEDCPVKCSQIPERYNLQNEYGSDEPYWVEENSCEIDSPENCLNCTIQYYKQKAKEITKCT